MTAPKLVLASQSPRRRELLAMIDVWFEVAVADIDETPIAGDDSATTARRLAIEKANTVLMALDSPPATVVLAADTLVDLDGEPIGKPSGPDEAARTLRRLSGRHHTVSTGVAVAIANQPVLTRVVTTIVEFREISAGEIAWYVDSGEPLDKAGAYGVRGRGGAFVSSIDGSHSNVVGLPLVETVELLGQVGITVMQL